MNKDTHKKVKDADQPIENEYVIVHVNRHWIRLARPFIGITASWTGAIILFNLAHMSIDDQALSSLLFLLGVIMLITSHHWFFYRLIRWKLSSSVITNQRVIHFKNLPFLKNDVLYVLIEEIHEVEEKMHGILPNILDYGNVILNLAAVTETISLRCIPSPATFSTLIGIIRENNDKNIEELQKLCEPYCKKYKSTTI